MYLRDLFRLRPHRLYQAGRLRYRLYRTYQSRQQALPKYPKGLGKKYRPRCRISLRRVRPCVPYRVHRRDRRPSPLAIFAAGRHGGPLDGLVRVPARSRHQGQGPTGDHARGTSRSPVLLPEPLLLRPPAPVRPLGPNLARRLTLISSSSVARSARRIDHLHIVSDGHPKG